ncbi:MAG: hypothetical protein QXO86_01340 [Nitrososphaerota archaeon]
MFGWSPHLGEVVLAAIHLLRTYSRLKIPPISHYWSFAEKETVPVMLPSTVEARWATPETLAVALPLLRWWLGEMAAMQKRVLHLGHPF